MEDNGHNTRNQTFTDRHGREWDCTLTLASARRVDNSDFSELTPIEITILEPNRDLFQTLLSSKSLAMAVVWAIVQPQAQKLEIDETEFIDSLDGTAIATATDALWETLADFFPQAKTALSTLQRLQKEIETRAVAGLAKMSPKMLSKVQAAVDHELAQIEQELDGMQLGEISTPASEG